MAEKRSGSRNPAPRYRVRTLACRPGCGLAALVLLSCVAVAQIQGGGRQESSARLLQGRVTNRSSQPVAQAIVFLKNTKTLAVKTFIATPEGAYRFPALSPNVEYQVYAEHGGKRSSVKTLSAFDDRREAQIDLRIDK